MNPARLTLNRRRFLQLACGTAAAPLLWGCDKEPAGSSEAPGGGVVVFHNGTVLPVDEAFSEHRAFAIRDNKIIAVGDTEAVLAAAGPGAQMIDLGGRTVLPGFIEPHVHFGLMSLTNDWIDIGPLKYPSTEQALAALKAHADQGADDGWIVARQFDPSLQDGPPMLTTQELDAISSTRPVFVLNASGHLAYVNSRLLELSGIDRDTPNPPGAEYFRFADGSPNGAMTQKAWVPILTSNADLLKAFDTGAVDAGLVIGDLAASLGITTLCDMATGGASGEREIANYHAMFATGRMKSRIRAYLYSEAPVDWVKAGVRFDQGDANVRITGWKMVSDGSNQGLTGRQREPYLKDHQHGVFYVQPEELAAMVEQRARQGWPLALHGNGDAAIDSILDAIEAAAEQGIDVKSLRCRIEHSSILHDEQIERMARLGVHPSFLINHVYYWGQTMRDNVFGPDKVQLLDRCASVEKAGLKWTVHSDTPVSPLDSLHNVRVAVARDLWKEPGNVLAPQERVSVEAAIRAVTINAAWQCHSDHEIGSLEPGKLADFVILDADPRTVEPTKISDIGISETWMDGRQVYRS